MLDQNYTPKPDTLTNGTTTSLPSESSELRALEFEKLLRSVLDQLVPFIQKADDEVLLHQQNTNSLDEQHFKTSLYDYHSPSDLAVLLEDTLKTPAKPLGQDGLLQTLEQLLRYSVNPSAPGFLDKLYSTPVTPGIAADLILSVLNTNVHVYQVSPVLTLIEQHVTKALAALFGLTGPRAGGINVQGGSASNMTSIVIARNALYPETKLHGNSHNGLQLVMFTSAHGHYSIEKAAQQCGFGSESVVPVPVDSVSGRMIPSELERLIIQAKEAGQTPFYVNATAGTTVLGSFDPFVEIAEIAKKHGLWMHIDGAWGGSFVFSESLRAKNLEGSHLANSIAINPHKMMGVPVTCSFLLAKDLKQFHDSNTLRAGYLFHDQEGASDGVDAWTSPDDLADLTLQCGRRGDSLKLFMAWQYYGTNGYRAKIENAYDVACYMVKLIAEDEDFVLVSENPPPCLQVCFYYAPGGKLVYGAEQGQVSAPTSSDTIKEAVVGKSNSRVTSLITRALIPKGFMIDFAPALQGREQQGQFFRVVVNIQTRRETVERLVNEIKNIGKAVVGALRDEQNRSKS